MVVAQVARLELLAPEERLDPEQLMQDLKAAGKDAAYLPDVDAIVDHVAQERAGRRSRGRLQQRRLRRHPRQAAGAAGQALSRPVRGVAD